MMNPATMLADLLESWTVDKNQAPETARGMVSGGIDDLDFWRTQGQAARLLLEVERALQSMKDSNLPVDSYDALLPAWYQGVFGYHTPWKSAVAQPRRVVSVQSLAALRGLGAFIQHFNTQENLSEDEQGQLKALLSEVAEIIGDDQSIPERERRYMWGLLKEAQRCLEELTTFGAASLRSTITELSGAVMKESARSAVTGHPQKSNNLLRTAMRLANTFGTAFATEGAQLAIEKGQEAVKSMGA